MTEGVVEFDLGVDWNPGDEDCYLVQDGWGMTVFAIDSNWARGYDDRPVLIAWVGSHLATMGNPNDESIAGHRLYSKGFTDVCRSSSRGTGSTTRTANERTPAPSALNTSATRSSSASRVS